MPTPDISLTDDTLFNGRLMCRQHREGYRFSIDSVLVAHFCQIRDSSRYVLDLGTGCGIIGLILAFRYPALQIRCMEIQSTLARLATDNAQINNFSDRLSVIHGDIRLIKQFFTAQSFDFVVTNPPYRPLGSGRINPATERARARHEIDAVLADVIKAAAYAVKNKGSVAIVYPAQRLTTLLLTLHRYRLMPKRLQSVYSYPTDTNACLVLVEAVKNGGEELTVLPPLFIYSAKNGGYSDQVQKNYT